MADARIEPLGRDHVSLRRRVEEALNTAIIADELAPGELLSVPDLARRFQVSATPVREAILDLERRGFVEAVRNKGFRVTAPNEAQIRQIVAVRLLLEPPAIEALAGAIPVEGYAELREITARAAEKLAAGDLRARYLGELDFHGRLLDHYGNPYLSQIVRDLRQQGRVPDSHGLLTAGELASSFAEHDELVDLLERGEGRAARDLARRHIERTLVWLSRM